MIKIFASLLVAILALASAPAQATAQENGVAGLEILLVDAGGKVVAKTKTKADGSWSFGTSNLRASADYYLKIEEKAVSSARMAINQKGLPSKKKKSNARTASTGDLDGDGDLDFHLTIDENEGIELRDRSTGMATGKRAHKPVTFTKEWGASTPILFKSVGVSCTGKVTWSVRTN